MMIIIALAACLSLQLTSAGTQEIRDPSHLPDLFLFKKNSQCRDEDRKDCQQMSAFELFDTKFRRERQSGDFEDRNSSELTELFKRSAGELSPGLDDGQVQSKLKYSPTVDENFVSTTPSYGGQSTQSPSRKVERSLAVTERPAFSYQFTTTDGLGYVHVQIGKAATTPYPAHKKIPSAYHPSSIPSSKPYHKPPVISTTPYPVHKKTTPAYHHPPPPPAYHPAPIVHKEAPPVYHPAPLVHKENPQLDHPVPIVHKEAPPVYHPVPIVHKEAPPVYHPVPVVHKEAPPVYHPVPIVHKKPPSAYHPAPPIVHKELPPAYHPPLFVSTTPYPYHPSAVPFVQKSVKKTHLDKPKVATVTVKSMPDLKYHSEHAPHYTPVYTGHHHPPPVYQAPVYKPEVHYPAAVTPKPQYHHPSPKPQYQPPVVMKLKPQYHQPVVVTPKPQYQPPVVIKPKPQYHHPSPKPQYDPPVVVTPKPQYHPPVVVTPKPQYHPPVVATPKPQYHPPVVVTPKPQYHHPSPKPQYQPPVVVTPKPQYHPPVVVSSKPQYPPAYQAPAPAEPSYHPPAPTPVYHGSPGGGYHPAVVVTPEPTVLVHADSGVSQSLLQASSLEQQLAREKESSDKLGRVLEQFKNRSVLSLIGTDFKVSGPYFVVTPRPGREQGYHHGSISFPQ